MTEPKDTEAAPDQPDGSGEPDEELDPAFDVDLPPEEQGTAEAASEQSG